jgi:CHAD domain-containing protein
MHDGKWIEGLGPLLSVAEAARLALQVRLEVVRYFLPLAMHDSDRDLEHVHRLRVGTRRAAAALRIFGHTLPEKVLRKVRRTLRSLRQAAGEARDWDVFVTELQTRAAHSNGKPRAGLDFLIGYATGCRDAAQRDLLDAGEQHEDRLKTLIANLLNTIHDPEQPGAPRRLVDLGRFLLGDLYQELTWAAERNLDDYEHLHQVRILGKKLRYAIELFGTCFPSQLREEIYSRVEEMQEILGLANDSHVAGLRLDELRERLRLKWPNDWKRLQPGIASLLRYHRSRLVRQRNLFKQFWKQWQREAAPSFQHLLQGEPGANHSPMAVIGHGQV